MADVDGMLQKAEHFKKVIQADMEKRSIAQGKLEAALEGLQGMGYDTVAEAAKALEQLGKAMESAKFKALVLFKDIEKLIEEGEDE